MSDDELIVEAGDFARDTDVWPDESVAGRYHADLPEAWRVFYAFGGASMAVALRAAQRAIGRDDLHPITATAAFVSPVPCGPMVIDTEAAKILGEGRVDFRNERYDLTLNAQSKRPSLVALRGPIAIDGTFKNPDVHPETAQIAARVGTSIALGALNPLAALLPLIDLGGATDADCRALIGEASANVQARATPR